MKHEYDLLRECVRRNPSGLSLLTNKKIIRIAEKMLPYSIGIEVECGDKLDGYGVALERKCRELIPGLLDINCDHNEKRFRIPSGIKGMVCLYKISQFLKEFCELNEESGIHYHVDCSELPWRYIEMWENTEWILKSLDSWGCKGTYNARRVSEIKNSWVRIHEHYKTLEYRIGEMTFDYELLIKRILQVSRLTKKHKEYLIKTNSTIIEMVKREKKAHERFMASLGNRRRVIHQPRRVSSIFTHDP